MDKYIIISNEHDNEIKTLGDFENAVNIWLDEGYKLKGALIIKHTKEKRFYYQVMIKDI